MLRAIEKSLGELALLDDPTGRFMLRLLFVFLLLPGLVQAVDCVKIYREIGESQLIHIYADSQALYPCQVELALKSVQNLKADRPLPMHAVIAPGSRKVLLLTLRHSGSGATMSYNLMTRQARGDPAAEVDRDALYVLPFAHGNKAKLIQGYGGAFSHSGASEFSLDFAMEIGTPVHAARAGLVVETKSNSSTGGPTPAYNDQANYIIIAHEDGTYATYAHLKHGGVVARVGQKVSAGDLIGHSGNTGFSRGPHLHFEVSRPGIMEAQSIPVRIRTLEGTVERLREGEYYYALHPGGPSFKAVYGKDLKAEDFASHRQTIPRKDQVTLRTQKNDDTIIMYILNGYSQDKTVEIEFELTNLASSAPMPIRRRLPALSETFLILLQPINPTAAETRFSARYSISE